MARSEGESAASVPGGAGDPSILERVLEIPREWAGTDVLALFLSGSLASREAVWVTVDGRRVLLSDVDVYGLMPDPAAVAAAQSRMKRDAKNLHRRLLEMGVAAPVEAAFFTPVQLDDMVARPATIDLGRHARVIAGDEKWKAKIPRFTARDVSPEEIHLLLDNRGMELLYALALSGRNDPLSRSQRYHATMKASLDLAGVLCLLAGEYPDGAAGRVTLARGLRKQQLSEPMPWEEGIAWKLGQLELPDPASEREQWSRTVRGWSELWRRLHGVGPDETPWRVLLERAKRAPFKRRLKEGFAFRAAGRRGPSLASRLGSFRAGTPLHRLHATGAAVLLEHAMGKGTDRDYARTVAALGVARPGDDVELAARTVSCWDHWFLGGHRTADWS